MPKKFTIAEAAKHLGISPAAGHRKGSKGRPSLSHHDLGVAPFLAGGVRGGGYEGYQGSRD
jgi:hypothetical protein